MFGATGGQGRSVDSGASNKFSVRAVTRDPSKPAAQDLSKQGAEVVSGDLDDKESLRRVLSGAAASFLVTKAWEKKSAEAEKTQGKNVADVCKVSRETWREVVHLLAYSCIFYRRLELSV